MSTKDQPKTSRSTKKKKREVLTQPSGEGTKEKPKPVDVRKKAETPEKARLRIRDEGIDTALRTAFGTTEFDRGEPPAVVADLAFDGTRLTELADLVKEDADKLTKTNTTAQFARFSDRLDRFNFRLQQAQTTAARLKQVKDTAAGLTAKLTDSDFVDAWNAFNEATKDGDLERANGSLGELEASLKTLADVLTAYNAKSGQAPATKVPMGLYLMAGQVMPLDVLRRGLALVPAQVATVDDLRGLFAAADPPSALPTIVPLAAQAGIGVKTVLDEFGRSGNATKALNALRAITDAGQTAGFFITGRGGQRWVDLEYIGRRGIKAWPGGSQPAVHLGPPGPRSITLTELQAQTVRPLDGRKYLDDHQVGQDPNKPRYLGNKPFVNDGVKRGVVLPWANDEGQEIRYTEYDIRPYTSPGERGAERLVVGNDKTYYTSDHYKTFVEIRREPR